MIETIGAIKGITPIEILALIVLVLGFVSLVLNNNRHKENQKKIDADSAIQLQVLQALTKSLQGVSEQMIGIKDEFHQISQHLATHVTKTDVTLVHHKETLTDLGQRVVSMERVLRQ